MKDRNFYIFAKTHISFLDLFFALQVVLILQPLLGRNGKNICDVPVIAKETVRFEFLENAPTTSKTTIPKLKVTTPFTTRNKEISTKKSSSQIRDGFIIDDKKLNDKPAEISSTSVKPNFILNEKDNTTKQYWWLEQKKNITIDVEDKSNKENKLQNSMDISFQGPIKSNIENKKIVNGFNIGPRKQDKESDKRDRVEQNGETSSTKPSNIDNSESHSKSKKQNLYEPLIVKNFYYILDLSNMIIMFSCFFPNKAIIFIENKKNSNNDANGTKEEEENYNEDYASDSIDRMGRVGYEDKPHGNNKEPSGHDHERTTSNRQTVTAKYNNIVSLVNDPNTRIIPDGASGNKKNSTILIGGGPQIINKVCNENRFKWMHIRAPEPSMKNLFYAVYLLSK